MLEVPHTVPEGYSSPGWYLAGKMGNKTIVIFICPNGHLGMLSHEVAFDGMVSRSIVCPAPECRFHDHIRLIGWTRPE